MIDSNCHVGKKVIVRTYSAGIWFGELMSKEGNEVVLKNARRLASWHACRSVTISGVAKYGLKDVGKDTQNSIITTPTIEFAWIEAIEILSTTKEAALSIERSPDHEAYQRKSHESYQRES